MLYCLQFQMDGFDVYSKYGSNHEQAQRVLREMLQDQKILAFFSVSSNAHAHTNVFQHAIIHTYS